jgi:ketosteroid isomerase-like protein
MTQENVELVRRPLAVRERSSRTLDQRLALRFPRLAAACTRLIGRLAPSSRLRQAVLGRGVQLGLEAFNRRDQDAALLGCHPDCEFHPPRELVEAGLIEACYVGPAGYREYASNWSEVWGAELRLEPVELIDLGDHLVILADLPVRAQASGVSLTTKWADVTTLEDGRAVRQQHYWDHAEALQAVGLRE